MYYNFLNTDPYDHEGKIQKTKHIYIAHVQLHTDIIVHNALISGHPGRGGNPRELRGHGAGFANFVR